MKYDKSFNDDIHESIHYKRKTFDEVVNIALKLELRRSFYLLLLIFIKEFNKKKIR